ncbi:MAG: SDR family NAD(P)-dependent oxidoreductase [Actinobacteria bacterium]|nr:SDR family NAD(P)-dependent oxidoreductase [Actinomycetota bacterium]
MASFLDRAMDTLVVPGFSRVGYAVRSRSFTPLSEMSLEGKTVVVTGHTSGLGLAAAKQLRATGADLVLVGRDATRSTSAGEVVGREPGSGSVEVMVADMGDLQAVAKLASTITATHSRVDVVVHNAGALLKVRERTAAAHDMTLAVHVFGPFLLTHMLLPLLAASNGRVVTVASGGMYAVPLPDFSRGHSLELPDDKFDGTRQYAIAKRAQVTLNEIWASEPSAHGVSFHAMHPGWADTPGVASSIPVFRAVTRPILRNAAQGADTISWLAGVEASTLGSGGFWCDRERRAIHRLASTRRADTAASRRALWDQVRAAALGSSA